MIPDKLTPETNYDKWSTGTKMHWVHMNTFYLQFDVQGVPVPNELRALRAGSREHQPA